MSKHSVLVGAAIFCLGASVAGSALAQGVTGQAAGAGATQTEVSPPAPADAGAVSPAPADAGTGSPSSAEAVPPADTGTGSPASAEAAPPADAVPAVPAAYLAGPNRMTDRAIEEWTLAPRKLLEDNPRGGAVMIAFVRSLAGSDNRTVAALIDLAKMSDVRDAHVAAIGIGLARATQEAQTAAPGYAAYIQLSVASSGSTELIQAYERAVGDQPTAALGLGVGGGGGGSPGSGSLTGGGESGPAGAINGDDVVENRPPTSGSRGGSSVSFVEDDGLGTADGGAGTCDLDSSPAGCAL